MILASQNGSFPIQTTTTTPGDTHWRRRSLTSTARSNVAVWLPLARRGEGVGGSGENTLAGVGAVPRKVLGFLLLVAATLLSGEAHAQEVQSLLKTPTATA